MVWDIPCSYKRLRIMRFDMFANAVQQFPANVAGKLLPRFYFEPWRSARRPAQCRISFILRDAVMMFCSANGAS
jgi:hypothetical protein